MHDLLVGGQHVRISALAQYLTSAERARDSFGIRIKRAQHLIACGEAHGRIDECAKEAAIGSGAQRIIVDYQLDREGVLVLHRLSAGQKLNSPYPLRNECAILRLAAKYFEAKDVTFEFQPRRAGIVFDCIVDQRIALEFDEPHHQMSRKQLLQDARKDDVASHLGLVMLRFTLQHDVIDIILEVESMIRRMNPDPHQVCAAW